MRRYGEREKERERERERETVYYTGKQKREGTGSDKVKKEIEREIERV